MSKEPDLEDFTTLNLLVVLVFSDSRPFGPKNFDGRFEEEPCATESSTLDPIHPKP
jgi:hypothetical protein